METIPWDDFEKVDIWVGTAITAELFSEARPSAYTPTVDFGSGNGVKKSSAQLTTAYPVDQLLGRQLICGMTVPERTGHSAAAAYAICLWDNTLRSDAERALSRAEAIHLLAFAVS